MINLELFKKAYCEDLLSLKKLREQFNLTIYMINKIIIEKVIKLKKINKNI